ncbi:MAG: hypothetical protein RMJ90_03455, partial [Candidatus Bipolaricaulota bacterium]|nr:hypothetical protein [Candidatus Bipolaricaulota bacterium]
MGCMWGIARCWSARCSARERHLQSVAFVFKRPPQNYVGPPKPLILPVEKKLHTIERLVEIVVTVE